MDVFMNANPLIIIPLLPNSNRQHYFTLWVKKCVKLHSNCILIIRWENRAHITRHVHKKVKHLGDIYIMPQRVARFYIQHRPLKSSYTPTVLKKESQRGQSRWDMATYLLPITINHKHILLKHVLSRAICQLWASVETWWSSKAGPHGSGPHGSGPHGSGPHGSRPHGKRTHYLLLLITTVLVSHIITYFILLFIIVIYAAT